MQRLLLTIYKKMDDHFGDLKWWPAETPFEVIIGAILTQNTSWKNVEKVISKLKQKDLLTCENLIKLTNAKLSEYIRSSGYHNLKAARIKEICKYLSGKYNGQVPLMKGTSLSQLREELLSIKGIGPETADAILLYACNKPIFVVDTYAKRIFHRHGIVNANCSYSEVQQVVHKGFM
jgi:endonuclease III related protein